MKLDNVLFDEMTEEQHEAFEKDWILESAIGIMANCGVSFDDAMDDAGWEYEGWLNCEGAIARDEDIKWRRELNKLNEGEA